MKQVIPVLAAALLACPGLAFAGDGEDAAIGHRGRHGEGRSEARTEISILLGASLADVTRDEAGRSIPLPVRGSGPVLPPATPAPPAFVTAQRHDRRSLGSSALLGFKVGRVFAGRAVAELSFLVSPSHRLRREVFYECVPAQPCPLSGAGAPQTQDDRNVAAYRYDLNLGYDLARGPVRPFLSVGAGAVSYDTGGTVDTRFAFNLAGGAKLYFGTLGLRVEAGDHIVLDHFLTGQAEHDLQVRGGLVFRLP